jgi:hypothetical protein
MQIITKHPELSVAYFIIFAVFTHTKVLPANENCGIVVFASRRESFCCVNASLGQGRACQTLARREGIGDAGGTGRSGWRTRGEQKNELKEAATKKSDRTTRSLAMMPPR